MTVLNIMELVMPGWKQTNLAIEWIKDALGEMRGDSSIVISEHEINIVEGTRYYDLPNDYLAIERVLLLDTWSGDDYDNSYKPIGKFINPDDLNEITTTKTGFQLPGLSSRIRLGYYIRNRQLALSYPNGSNPDFSLEKGILVEYRPDSGALIDFSNEETTNVSLTRFEKKAVVNYLKAQYWEMLGDIQRKKYYEDEFRKYLNREVNNLDPFPRIMIHTGPTKL